MLGPEDHSFSEVAAIVADVAGHPMAYQQVPFDAFKQQLLSRGMPEDFAQGYVDMMRAKNEGMDNAAERVAAVVGPTNYRQWADEVLKPALAG